MSAFLLYPPVSCDEKHKHLGSFVLCLIFSEHHISGTVLGTGDETVNRTTTTNLCLAYILV